MKRARVSKRHGYWQLCLFWTDETKTGYLFGNLGSWANAMESATRWVST